MIAMMLILTAALTFTTPGDMPGGNDAPFPVLPDSIAGWNTDIRDTWDRSTLYQYINGGAELFLSYSFEEARSRVYAREEQPDITVDIFRFGAAEDAYGVYSMSREEENTDIGGGGQYGAGLLLFWKDRYYVSVLATPETPEAREAVMAIARHIEKQIEGETDQPRLLERFPEEGLRAPSVRYFRHHAWQNVYGLIAHEDVLGIGDSSEAAVAKYRIGDAEATVFLIRYPEGAVASDALARWKTHYRVPADANMIRNEDGCFTADIRAAHLILVHRATDEKTAMTLLNRVQTQLQ
jgi:hypothetical protein